MTPEELAIPSIAHDDIMLQQKYEMIDKIYAEDFVNQSPGLPDDQRRGRGPIRMHNEALHAAFSNMELINETPIVEGEMISFRWVFTATHTGNFYGLPATGKRFTIEGYDIMQIRDGKLINVWVYQDTAGMFAQLQG